MTSPWARAPLRRARAAAKPAMPSYAHGAARADQGTRTIARCTLGLPESSGSDDVPGGTDSLGLIAALVCISRMNNGGEG